MKRRIARLLAIYVLLGLVTTVSVAWAVAALSDARWIDMEISSVDAGDWLIDVPNGWPREPEFLMRSRGFGQSRSRLYAYGGSRHRMLPKWTQVELQVGLPVASLRHFEVTAEDDKGQIEAPRLSLVQVGVILPDWIGEDASGPRRLPTLPIWPGLAFNTVFYALLWWLAFASVRMVRHNRRYRRGLCPMCRYDLRADYSGGCSECGWKRA